MRAVQELAADRGYLGGQNKREILKDDGTHLSAKTMTVRGLVRPEPHCCVVQDIRLKDCGSLHNGGSIQCLHPIRLRHPRLLSRLAKVARLERQIVGKARPLT
jgi:hypothetical protein